MASPEVHEASQISSPEVHGASTMSIDIQAEAQMIAAML